MHVSSFELETLTSLECNGPSMHRGTAVHRWKQCVFFFSHMYVSDVVLITMGHRASNESACILKFALAFTKSMIYFVQKVVV
jgi:hypothetical protein